MKTVEAYCGCAEGITGNDILSWGLVVNLHICVCMCVWAYLCSSKIKCCLCKPFMFYNLAVLQTELNIIKAKL